MSWVAEPQNEVIIKVVDYTGKHASSQYWVNNAETDPASGGPAALAAAVQGITTGLVTATELLVHARETSPGSAGTGPYDRVQDKALVVLNGADGSPVNLQLPSPRQTIFLSDNYRVDPADSLMAALVSALVTYGKTAEGAAIVQLQRGFRRRPPRLKKQ